LLFDNAILVRVVLARPPGFSMPRIGFRYNDFAVFASVFNVLFAFFGETTVKYKKKRLSDKK
jgi:hypothetical protein